MKSTLSPAENSVTLCTGGCCDILHGYCCMLFVAILGNHSHLGFNQEARSFEGKKLEKVLPRSASTCEGRGSARLRSCLSFITYPDVTQLSKLLSGECADHCCPLCLQDDSGMTGRGGGRCWRPWSTDRGTKRRFFTSH